MHLLTVAVASVSTTTTNWKQSEIGMPIPDRYLVSLHVDTGITPRDAQAQLEDDLKFAKFQSLAVFDDLHRTVSNSGKRSGAPHMLVTLSPSGLKSLQAHPLVWRVEQDRVMGLTAQVYNNGTCQQQTR